MTPAPIREIGLAVAMAIGGCQLLVPSEADLSGGPRDAPAGDAGAEATDASSGPADASGGGALVQQTSAASSNASSVLLTLPSAPAEGHALVLVAASTEDTAHFVVKGGGAVWTARSTSSQRIVSAVWVGMPVSTGTTSITVEGGGATATLVAHVSEWAGLSTFAASVHNSGSSSISTAPIPTFEGIALVFAAAAAHNVTLGPPSNGFVPLDGVLSNDTRIVAAYRLSPTPGSYAASWPEPASTANGWDAHLLTFTR